MKALFLGIVLGFVFAGGFIRADDIAGAIPIHIATRNSVQSPGTIVVMIFNDSKTELDFNVKVTDAKKRDRKSFDFALQGSSKTSIGVQQGWKGMEGDVYTITCPGYPDMTYTVPPLEKPADSTDTQATNAPASGTTSVPIHFTTRLSNMTAGSIVTTLYNDSKSDLSIHVYITSAHHDHLDLDLDLPGLTHQSVGVEQGWNGAKGDVYKITCPGFEPTTYTVKGAGSGD